jgi:hypothetical protein
LRLHDLRFPEEGHKALVAGRLGVEGVTVAGIGAIQGVVEDAYKVVVLVPGACGLLPKIHSMHLSRDTHSTAMMT